MLAQGPRREEAGTWVKGWRGWRKVKIGWVFLQDLLRGIKAELTVGGGFSDLGAVGRARECCWEDGVFGQAGFEVMAHVPKESSRQQPSRRKCRGLGARLTCVCILAVLSASSVTTGDLLNLSEPLCSLC